MNDFIEIRKFLGNDDDKDVYLYIGSKYRTNLIIYHGNYFTLPKWAATEKLTFMQAVKIMNFRMKNRSSNNSNPYLNVEEILKKLKIPIF